jgi:prepilin-type N-terminal cleavage/methylation domain-containing protein
MNTPHQQRKQLHGFSLVEMAIVILIAGIMMGAGLSLLSVKQAAAQADVTQKHQETIKQALINYLVQKKRLPCPGDNTGTELTRSATLPTCPSYSGIVPYKELGLERTVALDGWENFIAYVVSPTPSALSTPPFNAWLYTYGIAAPQGTSNPSQSFWPSNTLGGITAKVNGTDTPGMVAALISYGKNGFGAVNIKGGTNDLSAAGADETQNITLTTPNTVFKRDTSDTPTGNAFDDVVMILSANDLTGPLISNGTFQSTQAALTQANNIVLGAIGKQNICPGADGCTSPGYYYTVPASPPAGVSDLGVLYTTTPINTTSYIDATSSSASAAYTLTASDGSTKLVSINELHGILLRTGF